MKRGRKDQKSNRLCKKKKKKMEEWLWLACKDGNAEEVITLLQNEQIDY